MSASVRASFFEQADLLSCAAGTLFGAGNAQLPMPPMLMIDRISHICEHGGDYGKGEVIAEFDICANQWFFQCHFLTDPVMPGCLGLDAMWQLLGFYLGWRGNLGKGRALGLGELKLTGQVLPSSKVVRYHLSIKRIIEKSLILAIADGKMFVDNELIYTAKDLRCGVFIQPTT